MTADDRIESLIREFSAPGASLGHLMCDRHPPTDVAFTVVQADLTRTDVTFGELSDRSRRMAVALRALGVRPGDRVATLMGKSIDFVTVVLGIWRLGAVHVPLFTAFGAPAIAYRLESSGASVVVCDASQRPKLEPGDDFPDNPAWTVIVSGSNGSSADLNLSQLLADAASDSSADFASGGEAEFIRLFTSGTTGKPKGVVVPVKALASFVTYLELGLDVTQDDVFWNAADPGWAYGLYYAIAAPLAAGRRSILLQSPFSTELTWRVLAEVGVTNLAAAPTVFRSLRADQSLQPVPLHLRRVTSAGEPLNPDVSEWGGQAFGCRIRDTYGQTELGMAIINGWADEIREEIREGSMGRPMPGWSCTVLRYDSDEAAAPGVAGRVAVEVPASPLMWFSGYADAPEKTAERFSPDGRYYYTGDVGMVDADGCFYFSSRDDDVIIMAGYRIGPIDVESVLIGDPSVAEAAVVGVPDDLRGEVIEAYVVLVPGVAPSAALSATLQDRVKRKLAAHAYPRAIHFLDELPKTPSGKIQRFQLRAMSRVRS